MRRLHVSRVTGRTFGRFSGRSVDFGDNSFIVVHGHNEAGKSTLSELIAWMIAGRHGAPIDTLKYGVRDEKIGGTVAGHFDGVAFSISRTFTVRDNNMGRAPAEVAPSIVLGERTITLAEWESLIAVATGQDFALRYRITDSDGPVSVRELLESLAIGSRVGSTPSSVMKVLEDSALKLIPLPATKTKTQAATLARQELQDARRAHDEALATSIMVDDLRAKVEGLTGEAAALDRRINEAVAEKGSIAAALELIPVRRDLDDAEAALAGAPRVPAEWAAAVAERARTEAAILELKSAERTVQEALRAFDEARAMLALDEATAEHLELDPRIEQSVTAHAVAVGAARAAIVTAEAESREATVLLARRRSEFEALAADIGLGTGEADALASDHIDDIAFSDTLSRWTEAAADVVRSNVKVKPATERRATRLRALEDAQREWDALGLAVDPDVLHRTGVTPAATTTSAGFPSIPVILGIASAIIAASVVHRWAGAIVTVIAMAWFAFTSLRGTRVAPTPPTVLGSGLREAGALVQARNDHIIADNSLTEIVAAHAMAETLCDDRRRSALTMLSQLGISSCSGPEQAAILRGKRAALKAARHEILSLESVIDVATSRVRHESSVLAAAESELAAIATNLGIARLGSNLDLHAIARVHDVITQRDAVRRSRNIHDAVRTRLTDLVGEPAVRELPADALADEFHRVLEIADKRSAAESRVNSLTERMRLATSGRPAVRELIDATLHSAIVLEEMMVDVDARLTDLRAQLGALTEQLGVAKARIVELESRADLPDINYRVVQAESQLQDAVKRGVAARFASKVVADIKDEYERDNQPALIRHASDMVRRATNGVWRGLKVSEDGSRLEVMWGDSLILPESSLSAGGRDLLRLAVRIAVADAHGAKNDVSLPLICDDPTSVIDAFRTPEVLALLAECSRARQVIMMTPQEETVRMARRAGAAVIDITPD